MTHREEEKEPEPQTPAEESDSEQEHENDGLSPEAKEIEEDPSLNPDNEILRDIRGG
jgi:hypothetical protein